MTELFVSERDPRAFAKTAEAILFSAGWRKHCVAKECPYLYPPNSGITGRRALRFEEAWQEYERTGGSK